MRLTATDFRNWLFPVLERAAQGEIIQVTSKGPCFRIVAEHTTSKLDKLTKRALLNGTPEEVDQALVPSA
jgi:prevent-host-death family protein